MTDTDDPAASAPSAPIRVTPRVRSRAELAATPTKLVATLLSVATAGMLESGRFRRGREYASEGAVIGLVVAPRTVHGTVMGSRREPYEVEIHTDLVPPPHGDASTAAALMSIIPDADEIHAMCTCPDAADSVCKHAAAVLLSFAEEAAERPSLLTTWRCGDAPRRERATIGSRRFGGPAEAGLSSRHDIPRLADRNRRRPIAPTSPFATPAWLAFVAFAGDFPDADDLAAAALADGPAPATGGLPLGSERIGGFDLSSMVRSAQQAMRAASHDIV